MWRGKWGNLRVRSCSWKVSRVWGPTNYLFYLWRWLFSQERRGKTFLFFSSGFHVWENEVLPCQLRIAPYFKRRRDTNDPSSWIGVAPLCCHSVAKTRSWRRRGENRFPVRWWLEPWELETRPIPHIKKTKKWMRKNITLDFWPLGFSKEVGDYIVGFLSRKVTNNPSSTCSCSKSLLFLVFLFQSFLPISWHQHQPMKFNPPLLFGPRFG